VQDDMAIAHEQWTGATFDERGLIPQAAAPGFVPETEMLWLEQFRVRHEGLAERLRAEVLVPQRVRKDHEATAANWSREVRLAASSDSAPPQWSPLLSNAWLAGRVDAVEAGIAQIVDDIREVLREADAAIAEHAQEIADLRLEDLHDGYGGLLTASESRPRPPIWAMAFDRWLRIRSAPVADLETYNRQRHERRPRQELVA
jgi:hypothetical protein